MNKKIEKYRRMIKALNHITLAVENLDTSLTFYTKILDFKAHVRWDKGAYLQLGDLWLCLAVGEVTMREDYSHIAFSIDKDAFKAFADKLTKNQVLLWKVNKSEGESIYFLDPDKHKLEAHVGDLQSRLMSLRDKPYSGLQWLD